MDEARAAAGLSHPIIVAVYDVREYDGLLFIIMELVEGKSLRDESIEDLDRILEINLQLCEALAHAHQHNAIHRDLKPENVLLVDGQVKLMDFGLTRSITSRLSADGDLAGTAFTWHLSKRWVWRLMRGQDLTELGDDEKAAEIYQESIDILSNLGSQLELGRALYQRGRMLNIKNQTDAAGKDLKNTRLIFEECGAKYDLWLTLV